MAEVIEEVVVKEVARGKEWAEGLTQKEFEPEFMRRHPKSDCIPIIDKWIYLPYTNGSKEKYMPEQPRVKPPVQEQKEENVDESITCKCGRVFKGKPRFAHYATHKKKCVDYQNSKLGGQNGNNSAH